ncbi:complex I NDUFA9 subunit family protein [Pelagibacterales bacterium]|nr:complex I NDUFA9 subunit family protein [Pelagibacterales bacterium]
MNNKVITIFGAGFIGKSLIFELLQKGYIVKAICRNPYLRGNLRSMANIGQLDIKYGDITKSNSIESYFESSDIIINLVGVLAENSKNKYQQAHVIGPSNIGKLSKKYNIKRLIHISSIGADIKSNINYQKTKGEGELALKDNFNDVSIIRPSIVFGPEDGFFNVQAKLLKLSPVIPIFGGGKNKFQPVYINDLVNGIIKIFEDDSHKGKIFEFGGPDIMTMKEVYQFILKELKIKRLLIPAPIFTASVMAKFIQLFPNPIITSDLVKALEIDNIISGTYEEITSLGIEPKSPYSIVPTYL